MVDRQVFVAELVKVVFFVFVFTCCTNADHIIRMYDSDRAYTKRNTIRRVTIYGIKNRYPFQITIRYPVENSVAEYSALLELTAYPYFIYCYCVV